MDINMPGMNGIEATAEIKKKLSRCKNNNSKRKQPGKNDT